MDDYKKDLQIDRNNLDEECIRQPVLFDIHAQDLIPLYKERDTLELQIELLSAQLDGVIRESASVESKKLTEPKIKNEIMNNEQYQKLNNKYLLLCASVKSKEAIRDAFQQRRDMLKLLVELYIAGYWQTTEPSVNKIKRLNAIEEKLVEKMREDRK